MCIRMNKIPLLPPYPLRAGGKEGCGRKGRGMTYFGPCLQKFSAREGRGAPCPSSCMCQAHRQHAPTCRQRPHAARHRHVPTRRLRTCNVPTRNLQPLHLQPSHLPTCNTRHPQRRRCGERRCGERCCGERRIRERRCGATSLPDTFNLSVFNPSRLLPRHRYAARSRSSMGGI